MVVRTEAKSAILRWYPGQYGAQKYVLQQRFVESLDTIQLADTPLGTTTTKVKPSSVADDEWTTIYEGPVRLAVHSTYLSKQASGTIPLLLSVVLNPLQ